MEETIDRLRVKDLLFLCILGLLCLGVLMVQSASMQVTGKINWQWSGKGLQHFIFAAAALATFWTVGRLDYAKLVRPGARLWRQPTAWLAATAAVACVLVLIPHVGKEVNGARRWLPMGFIQVQPSELAKWSLVLLMAWWLSHPPVRLENFFKGFLPTLLPICLLCLLVVIEDLGTAALMGLCALVMMIAGRVKWWHLAVIFPPAMAVGLWFLRHKEYRWKRIVAFMDPYAAPQKEGYHMIQSLLCFSTGGLSGRGLGNGIQKLGYLPEDTTDFIFAVICEELGLFGALLTMALYAGIILVAWQVMRRQRDSFGRMLAFGVAAMTGLQAIINIAVATVSMPTKGVSLPLVSAGGSGLVITAGAMGLLYSTVRHVHREQRLPLETQSAQTLWKELTAAA